VLDSVFITVGTAIALTFTSVVTSVMYALSRKRILINRCLAMEPALTQDIPAFRRHTTLFLEVLDCFYLWNHFLKERTSSEKGVVTTEF
jgi:hypothetical protein